MNPDAISEEGREVLRYLRSMEAGVGRRFGVDALADDLGIPRAMMLQRLQELATKACIEWRTGSRRPNWKGAEYAFVVTEKGWRLGASAD